MFFFKFDGEERVDWRELCLEVRNVRFKIHLEVKPNRTDDAVGISVMYTKMEIEALGLVCL